MQSETDIRIRSRISTKELERRWAAVRQAMKERKLDFLIIQGYTDILGGYIKWFTDLPALNNYTSTIIFPCNEEMTTIWHGGFPPARPSPPEWAVRGVKKRISVPTIPSLDYSNAFHAEKVVEELKNYPNCCIGLVGMGLISASLYSYITKHLPSTKFEEATDLVDEIKVIKSEEEIQLIKETCEIQDKVFEYILTRIQPGKTDHQVCAEVTYKCRELGGTRSNIMGVSAPAGKAATLMPVPFDNRTVEEGDQFNLLIEANGPSGFWAEVQRVICLGKIPAELEDQFEICKQAQQASLAVLKPGVAASHVLAVNNDFMKSRGLSVETRIYAHGMGYDMVERPAITGEETMILKAGMNIAVHPAVVSGKAAAHVCENFIITESGAPICLHKTPQKLFSI